MQKTLIDKIMKIKLDEVIIKQIRLRYLDSIITADGKSTCTRYKRKNRIDEIGICEKKY